MGEADRRESTSVGGQYVRADLRGGRIQTAAHYHLVEGQYTDEGNSGSGEYWIFNLCKQKSLKLSETTDKQM